MSQKSDINDERRVSWPQRHHQQHFSSSSAQQQSPGDLTTPETPTSPTFISNNHHRLLIPVQQQQQQSSTVTTSSSSSTTIPPTTLSPQKELSHSAHNVSYSSSEYPETYSVLPVGHGNFLKVYHTIDTDQQNQQQQIIYNNYELFSNNCQPSSQIDLNQVDNNSQSKVTSSNDECIQVHGMHSVVPPNPSGFGVTEAAASTTNMIISKLVNNWSPNLTGTYTQFEDQNTSFVDGKGSLIHENHYTTPLDDSSGSLSTGKSAQNVGQKSVVINNATGNSDKTHEVGNSHPEVKKRNIAEVKPMRMSYSDVLSKINNQAAVGTPNGVVNNQKNDYPGQTAKSPKSNSDKIKTSGFPTERKVSPTAATADKKKRIESQSHRKLTDESHSASLDNLSGFNKKGGDRKNSPTHDDKENVQIFSLNSNSNKNSKKIPSKSFKSNSKQTGNLPSDAGDYNKKKYNLKRDEDQTKSSNLNTSQSSSSTSGGGAANYKEGFYNVSKTNNMQFERFQKYNTSQQNTNSSSSVGNNIKKNRLNSSGTCLNSKTSNRFEKQLTTRRGGQNRDIQKKSSNDKYELLKTLVKNFLLKYTVQILTWLFYLMYDIIVIGFSILYERLSQAYDHGYAYFLILRKDLQQNSNKPSIWIRNYLKKIDSKFKKNSKWAFWRRFYKKKLTQSSTESFKTGRLPQTGEEAMYSLLNCKGKDAYSILGVPANSSQEQIRKHYKKIAVLVHPDKNKQPGAEEAFKVLQRAFELIGEAENRAAYDQSLVEALHAEKAWTELHDLLSQLQTKIAEAANTIRCSSCGLRHPRKITDRPHYAARECGSCKIRHSAREGDIWAETNWLRLHWKYLALMEGKVYDITEWAYCQKGALSHLPPNSHIVQYRIVRGGQQQQQQQQQQQKQQPNSQPPSGATLDEFLDNLYSGQNQHGTSQNATRRRPKRN
ncbi:ras guanine nucleotide exchange factor P [Episyrphus balteatus]|uniref:ras guanine nucleotide exchange factor P n=1 Tax=Episyrphus balteatus TaxID=286459 RepID=UPI002484DF95|nr:ras guanine nucleotide exchange factor P [Episyrphus balteatus]